MNISEQVLRGNRLALSRLLSMIENSTPEGQSCLDELFTHTGKSHIIGITGPSGSGKSTLVNRLALRLALPDGMLRNRHPSRWDASQSTISGHAQDTAQGKVKASPPQGDASQSSSPSTPFPLGCFAIDKLRARSGQAQETVIKTEAPAVAVLAVDPSSPFSGGALLGDRVRMRDLMNHPEIFIRSMATRGALGGLARAASEMVLALEAGGFDIIIVETVGAGQSEVDIARLAHTTIVVEAPGLGDGIQAGKAGILEIADILVVNKSDKSGAESAARHLANMLEIGAETHISEEMDKSSSWKVPVLKTSALNESGIGELADMIAKHRVHLLESGDWKRRERTRMKDLFERILHEEILAGWRDKHSETEFAAAIDEILQRRTSPRQAVDRLF